MSKFGYFLIFAVAFLSFMPCMARIAVSSDTISARYAFMEMPASVLDMLSKDTRFNMLAYYDNDSIFKAPNNLKGSSYLERVTDNFLDVKITEASTMQLKVLKTKDGNDIVMVIYTTGREGESPDSDIRFYDSDFNELQKDKYFPAPKLSEFFDLRGYKTSMKEIEAMLPFYSILFQANPDTDNISGRLVLDDILTTEDRKIVDILVIPSVTFEWNGKRYKAIKQSRQ